MMKYEEPKMEILIIDSQVVVQISNGGDGTGNGEYDPWAQQYSYVLRRCGVL